MNARFIRAVSLSVTLLLSAFMAKGEDTPMLVVVEKDGTAIETPVPQVSRVDFDTFSLSVLSKDGGSKKYDYDQVERIELGKMSGISLPGKDARLAVWPTVTSSTIYVSGTEADDMIYVFGMNGVQQRAVKASKDVNEIDVTGLAAGQYVLTAGSTSVRFIKNKPPYHEKKYTYSHRRPYTGRTIHRIRLRAGQDLPHKGEQGGGHLRHRRGGLSHIRTSRQHRDR